MPPEFTAWPKIHRLFRPVVITEKVDGTNAAILVEDDGSVWAQSRKRIITPQQDNYGFARWVSDNSEALVQDLGPGIHFGEWAGHGIQRGYGLDKKWFALFNAPRWRQSLDEGQLPERVTVVPTLYEGDFSERAVRAAIDELKEHGSYFGKGPAEGVVVYHIAANQAFKVLCENDEIPKGVLAHG